MRVEITVRTKNLPPHTPEQLREWLAWELGVASSMSMENPLNDCDLQAESMTVKP